MRLLLDTHIAVWWITDDAKLRATDRQLIEHESDDVFVSVVSIWEIAIKHALRRGRANDMHFSGRDAYLEFQRAHVDFLPVSPDHAAAVGDLPPFHGDPFDRMLVAQALTEPLLFLTHDARLKDYGSFVRVV